MLASSRDTLTIEAHNLEQSSVKEQGRSPTAATRGRCGPSPSPAAVGGEMERELGRR
jgi:hypothetical protein